MRIINKILYTCIIMLVFMTSINTVEAQALWPFQATTAFLVLSTVPGGGRS